jgi:hypothetical protein
MPIERMSEIAKSKLAKDLGLSEALIAEIEEKNRTLPPPPLINLRPRDLIDMKFDQHVWWASETGLGYMTNFLIDKETKRRGSDTKLPPDVLARGLSEAFREADSYFITEDMRDVCMAAAETMPPVRLRPDLLPSDYGMFYIQGALPVIDVHKLEYNIEVLLWIRNPKHLLLFHFDATPRDLLGRDLIRFKVPELSLLHFNFYPWGSTPDEFADGATKYDYSNLTDEEFEEVKGSELAVAKFMLSSWSIMETHVSRKYVNQPDRAQRRRWKRRDLVPEDVTIITLRRIAEHDRRADEPTPVNWSHRWWVNGHWRKNVRDPDRPIWVNGHVKGPDDKPLIIKHRVNLFRR